MNVMNDHPEIYGTVDAVIDLDTVDTAAEFHSLVEEQLPVPEYYGRNLDALNDFLTSYFRPLNIVFLNYDKASDKANSGYYAVLRRMCETAASENEYLNISWR